MSDKYLYDGLASAFTSIAQVDQILGEILLGIGTLENSLDALTERVEKLEEERNGNQ